MKALKSFFAAMFITLAAVSCSNAPDGVIGGLDALKSEAVTYTSEYPQVYLRGTFNAWGTKAMTLIADDYWEAEVTFGSTANERFKFDVYGDWKLNFGDNEGDSKADQNGKDIKAEAGKTIIISFNSSEKYYYSREKTYQADCVFTIPSGVDAYAFAANKVRLYEGTTDRGGNYIYVDTDANRIYSPLSGLLKGSYTAKYDGAISGKRYVGEVSFTIDGSADSITTAMTVTEGSIDNFGTLDLTVYVDRWENNKIVSGGWRGVGIYRGDWHAGDSIGSTNDDGRLVTLLTEGAAQMLGVFIMTGSHTAFQNSLTVDIVRGKTTKKEVHYCPTSMYIAASHNAGMGNALYITGASDHLGNWTTAYKMTWDNTKQAWIYNKQLPVHLPFKVVKAKWVNGDSISTSQATWEQGNNRECYSQKFVGYDGYAIEFTPFF